MRSQTTPIDFEGTHRYRRVRTLGQGGMGAVFEVEDRETGRRLALKTMLAAGPDRLLRFKREFRIAAELDHPNLVRLLDLGVEGETWFLTMELVEGRDLSSLLLGHAELGAQPLSSTVDLDEGLMGRRLEAADVAAPQPDGGGLRPPACDLHVVRDVVAQVLDALDYLHRRGVVHRDLKPSNLMLDRDGRLRVLDFGLASRHRLTEEDAEERKVVGTVAYMSPEQSRGERATPASDCYALGCVLFTLLAGRPPFEGSVMEIIERRLHHAPPRLDGLVEGVPQSVIEICARLMARAPAERADLDAIRVAFNLQPAARRSQQESEDSLFVGRHREQTAMHEQLVRVGRGELQVIAVSGSSGIGKSSLVAVVSRWARMRGFLCLEGRCYERERIRFLALDRAMDALLLGLQQWPAEALEGVSEALRQLRPLFPAAGILLAESEVAAAPSRRAAMELATDAFVALLERCQQEMPLLLALDDLQWTDGESMALLRALVERGQGRIAVFAVHRPEAEAPGHRLSPLLAAAEARQRLTRVRLGGLDLAETTELVSESAAGTLRRPLARALAEQTRGQPFLARLVAEHVALTLEAEDGDLPPLAVSTLLSSIIATFTDEAEELLALAATASAPLAVDLARGLMDLSAADFERALTELASLRFVQVSGDRLRVYHDRICELAYDRLAPHRRRFLHARLAEALAEAGGSAGQIHAHWAAAERPEMRRRYAVKAAREAEARLAFGQAARLWLEAREEGVSDAEDAELWFKAGDLFESAGQLQPAIDAYERGLAAHARAGASDRILVSRIYGQLGKAKSILGDVEGAASAFGVGLGLWGLVLERTLPQRIPRVLWLLLQLRLFALLPDHWLRRTPTPMVDGRVAAMETCVRGLAMIRWVPAVESALRVELETRRHTTPLMHVRSRVTRVARMAMMASGPRRVARCEELLREAERYNREVPDQQGTIHVLMARAALWLSMDPTRARHSARRAMEHLAQIGLRYSFHGILAHRIQLSGSVQSGHFRTAIADVGRPAYGLRGGIFDLGFANTTLALAHSLLGEMEEAEAAVVAVDALLERVAPSRLNAWARLARWHVWLCRGEPERVVQDEATLIGVVEPHGASLLPSEVPYAQLILAESMLAEARHVGRLSWRRARRIRGIARRVGAMPSILAKPRAMRLRALTSHLRGGPRAVRDARRAVERARETDSPYCRWLCLHAARSVGAATDEERDELESIGAAEGYRMWPHGC